MNPDREPPVAGRSPDIHPFAAGLRPLFHRWPNGFSARIRHQLMAPRGAKPAPISDGWRATSPPSGNAGLIIRKLGIKPSSLPNTAGTRPPAIIAERATRHGRRMPQTRG